MAPTCNAGPSRGSASSAEVATVTIAAPSKEYYRRLLRQLVVALPEPYKEWAAEQAAYHFSAWQKLNRPQAQVIGLYAPLPDEINPAPLCKYLPARSTITYPENKTTGGLQYRALRDPQLDISFAGLHGQLSGAALSPDLIIVPLLGYNAAGYRLGRGGGHFDRTLAAWRAAGWQGCAVGYGFYIQSLTDLPVDKWDERLDVLVTEQGVLTFV